ncbi:MAG: IS1595 family transposase, partial [Nitrospinaceae bacterium]|nr:IS1595 family transposase [Nitrospinaceae bacterium]
MHERKCRLNGKFRAKLIEILVAGTTARAIAEITGVNQNT